MRCHATVLTICWFQALRFSACTFPGGQRWLLLRVPSGPDSLDGAGGNDTIHGFEGDDTLKGGDGDDRLFGYGTGGLVDGGDGDDWILAGNDSI